MDWEDILKISAGERSDAERFADPEDLNMDGSGMREIVFGYRKRLSSLMNKPKKIKETLQNRRHLSPVLEDFLINEAMAINDMNLDFLDKRLTRIEEELNKDSPNMFKVKRMQKAYADAFKNMLKPLRELRRERQKLKQLRKQYVGSDNNKQNYQDVLEVIERLNAIKGAIHRDMDKVLDEQISVDEMREAIKHLHRGTTILESYYG